MTDPTSSRSFRRAPAAVLVFVLAACQPSATVAPTPAPTSAAHATPTTQPTATPAPSPIVVAPVAVDMSGDVPATTACGVPAGRTLKLTELAGPVAYGYEAALTPYSEADSDRGNPQVVPYDLAICELATGAFTRVHDAGLRGHVAAQDAGRLLFETGNPRFAPSADSSSYDLATGTIQRLDAFVQNDIFAIDLDGDLVLGEDRNPTTDEFSDPSVPAVLDLRTGQVRTLTPAELGLPDARWFRPKAISDGVLVGLAEFPPDDDRTFWAFDLGTGHPIQMPPELRDAGGTVTAFDGQVLVGALADRRDDGGPQPFAWRIGDAHATLLPVGKHHRGGMAIGIDGDLVAGNIYGPDDYNGEFLFHVGMRGVVWDLRTGKMLDLGTGPAAMSGTMATEANLAPQSMAAAIEGHRVLGFLGAGCDGDPWCASMSFGGTPIVWDISAWIAALGG
ncbi:MAG TPA: hypothetical protein VFI15_01400 [Candidatus Limnocylindrales bacterium]|nr:hypothetical protein [Candidatus Limnocylindrales bacterium]